MSGTGVETASGGYSEDAHRGTGENGGNVESLGEALAGVSLSNGGGNGSASASPTKSFSTTNAGSPAHSSSFGLSAGPGNAVNNQGGNVHNGSGESQGWGNFADVSSETVFTGVGSEKPSVTAAEDDQFHNESIQLFLSKDPSQTLGEDVFKLSHNNLSSLSQEQQQAQANASGNGSGGPVSSDVSGLSSDNTSSAFRLNTGLNQQESPTSAVTAGTASSSRSDSPHGRGNTIQAYHQPYESNLGGSDGSNSNSGYGNNPASPYQGKPDGNGLNGFSAGVNNTDPAFVQPAQPAGNGQVLYMAVATPDGRGQVLQPVQMVQLPGKQMAYVVAGQMDQVPPAAVNAGQQPQQPLLTPDNIGLGGLGAIGSSLDNGPPRNNTSPNNLVGNMNGNPINRGNSFGADSGNRYDTRSNDEYARGPGASNGSGGQFHADPAIASLYSSPQRPPLDSLLGQVRRLSRDQVGCRLVQQALDEEGPMAASLVLQEGLPFWGEAMVDPFGNYLFQKILEKVTPDERVMLVKSVSSRLVNASLNLHGTRSVQKVVELCAQDEDNGVLTQNNDGQSSCDILMEALTPAAARLCIDSHGNHVIQRIILKLGPKYSEFVFDAVATSVGDVARHRHGCCVIQRCLDSPPSDARSNLVRRIVEKSLELMQDAYGNYVVQYVLDVCSDEDVQAVCESVVGKVNLLAIQKFSSNVMEKCLERCSERVKEKYMDEMSDPERVRELMMDPFGNYVVQRALSVATHSQAIRLVEAMRPHLVATQTGNGQRNGGVRNTAGGRRIIAKICRRFPNFTLTPVVGAGGHPEDIYRRNNTNNNHVMHHQHHHQQQSYHHQHSDDDLYQRNRHQGGQQRNGGYGSSMLSSYSVGPPQQQPQNHFIPRDNRIVGQPIYQAPQQQAPIQSYYGLGAGAPAASANPYYDQFGGLGVSQNPYGM